MLAQLQSSRKYGHFLVEKLRHGNSRSWHLGGTDSRGASAYEVPSKSRDPITDYTATMSELSTHLLYTYMYLLVLTAVVVPTLLSPTVYGYGGSLIFTFG